jgi:HEAT repeats
MSESDGKTELTGLARSIDALFSGRTETASQSRSLAMDVAPAAEAGESRPTLEAETAPGEPGSGLAEAAMIGTAGAAGALLDDPWSDEAVVERAAVEEAVSEAVAEEPFIDRAVVDDVTVEEAVVEEPFSDEAVVEDPFSDRAVVDEVTVEEAVVEEPAFGEPIVDEPIAEEAIAEESLVAESAPVVLPTDDAEALDEDFVEGPLDIAVRMYVEGDLDRGSEITSLAADLMSSRDIDPIARAVAVLTLAAGDPPDASVYAVAESIMDPVVLALLARQMGAERIEERRRDYYTVCRTIGDEMAVAVRNDLAETTDRLARRIHCEALVEMGASGRRMIEEMAEDENRFLVRNAVAILGDVGGDRAIELVTSALANPDPRVRREALKSLVKLESKDSGELVLGLLDDADDDVRLAAAVAAGELQVGRALKPLILMLEASRDPDECLPVIRALGELGDPGAVNSIEKHAVRTLFNKPRTDVRIAAYRSLHQIGTPRAKQLLLEVVRDKDEEVKTAVKGMLYAK